VTPITNTDEWVILVIRWTEWLIDPSRTPKPEGHVEMFVDSNDPKHLRMLRAEAKRLGVETWL